MYRKPNTGVIISSEKQVPTDIIPTCIPDAAYVALQQDHGAEARILVKKGQIVAEGDIIGERVSDGSYVHAPISGNISEIGYLTLSDGRKTKTVKIDFNGSFQYLSPKQSSRSFRELDEAVLIQRIRDGGLIQDFYSYKELAELIKSHKKVGVSQIVFDLLEVIPGQITDSTYINSHDQQVLEGLEIISKIFSGSKIAIIIDVKRKREFKSFLMKAKETLPFIEEVYTHAVFPASNPEFLIPLIFKHSPQESLDPMKLGFFLIKARTLFSIQEAVILQKPQLDKAISLGGSCMTKPSVVRARIGTPLYQIIEDAGGLKGKPDIVVLNDPFKGHVIDNLDLPLTKDIDAIFAYSEKDRGVLETSSCVQCGICIRQCPMKLEPDILFRLIQKHDLKTAFQLGLDDCSQCGICSFTCPSHLPLTQTFSLIKQRSQPQVKHD